MKRVLVLATTTGYQIRSFGDAAGRLGLRLVFASDRCDRLEDPWWDGAIAVRFHDEGSAVTTVLRAFDQGPPDGMIAVGDRPTVLAAHLSAAWGRPGNPPAAAAASRNKVAARRAFQAAGLPVPDFQEVSLAGDPEALLAAARYPAILKPLALSGSRGVMRVDDGDALSEAFGRLRRLMQSPDLLLERDALHDRALLESFIPGREFAVEGVLTRGSFTAFAIFDKPDPLDGPFFEETIYVTPSRASNATQRQITTAVERAANALGLWHGPVHAECRVNGSGVYVLEVAARPIGGLCSKALRFRAPAGQAGEAGEDVSLEQVLLRHAVGDDVGRYTREPLASGVMMIPIPRRGIYRGVEGVDDARGVTGVYEVSITARSGTRIVPLPEGRSYLGFIFARAATPQAVEGALRAAHARLLFQIDRPIDLV